MCRTGCVLLKKGESRFINFSFQTLGILTLRLWGCFHLYRCGTVILLLDNYQPSTYFSWCRPLVAKYQLSPKLAPLFLPNAHLRTCLLGSWQIHWTTKPNYKTTERPCLITKPLNSYTLIHQTWLPDYPTKQSYLNCSFTKQTSLSKTKLILSEKKEITWWFPVLGQIHAQRLQSSISHLPSHQSTSRLHQRYLRFFYCHFSRREE